jgi:hypothetical protein
MIMQGDAGRCTELQGAAEEKFRKVLTRERQSGAVGAVNHEMRERGRGPIAER